MDHEQGIVVRVKCCGTCDHSHEDLTCYYGTWECNKPGRYRENIDPFEFRDCYEAPPGKEGDEVMPTTTEPPFDGKPCPFCPVEVRNLLAVAHNLLVRYDDPNRRGAFLRSIEDLRAAVKACEPLCDAHFADPLHSHGGDPHAPISLHQMRVR